MMLYDVALTYCCVVFNFRISLLGGLTITLTITFFFFVFVFVSRRVADSLRTTRCAPGSDPQSTFLQHATHSDIVSGIACALLRF